MKPRARVEGAETAVAPLNRAPLRLADMDSDPFRQFGRWFEDARVAGVEQPEAAALATATRSGLPSARFVLVKRVDERGFTFFTNHESRKGRELADNPHAALVYYWEPTDRQVRVEGRAERTSPEESDAYFATRPRGSRVATVASEQSRPLESRRVLEARIRAIEARHDGTPVPRPPNWGGIRVAPRYFEFWQEGDDRVHDRFAYERTNAGWSLSRLNP